MVQYVSCVSSPPLLSSFASGRCACGSQSGLCQETLNSLFAVKSSELTAPVVAFCAVSYRCFISLSARVIVFVIGGVCYSELRSAYEAMHAHGREVSTW